MSLLTKDIIASYLPTIGIECHVQLKTKTKLFSNADNDARNAKPNTTISELCLGLPGTLPVLNKKAVELAIRAGLAMNCKINLFSKFDRKHYFYPDLPKGYQITQFDQPTVGEGKIDIELEDGTIKTVRITRAHIEEDAGKLTHPNLADYSLIDLNRAGTPLIEIVSEPDMHTSSEGKAYTKALYLLMKYADVSDCDLYHGNMRFDVNISVAKHGSNKLGIRSEIKNLNSFRSVEKAIDFEIKRQIELLEDGKEVIQETRGWDDSKQKTFSQRSKEDAHDYRYFPDPDIPPIVLEQDFINKIKSEMPKLPSELKTWLLDIGVSPKATETLVAEPRLMQILQHNDLINSGNDHIKRVANWLASDIQRETSQPDYDWQDLKLSAKNLLLLSQMVEDGKLNSNSATKILLQIFNKDSDPLKLAEEQNLLQSSNMDDIKEIVKKVLLQNPKAVSDYNEGQFKVMGFLVGQVMKESAGRANPGIAQQLIKELLN
jgi:aspartyl-tRNA(Asn)/glutamyl-tRNA(Gln) amidotransferase subunit B